MNKKTVLCIDDEKMIRETICDFLDDSGYAVIKAENGIIGIEKFREYRPDIVLIDLRMPGMDGMDVLAEIKAFSPETPVVIVSGAGLLKDAINALRLGAWDFITKPIEDMEMLELTIERCLERARLIEENTRYKENLEDLITERTQELEKTNKKLQIAKDKALESSRTKSIFLATMSHELRTPMNSILGYAYLLKNDNSLSPEQKEYAGTIEISTNRLLNTINDILYISSSEYAEISINKNDTILNDLMKKMYSLFITEKSCYPKKDIELIMKPPESLENFIVSIDREKVEQVFKRLLSNALKFTDKGKIEFGYTIKDKVIVFFVTDTGAGIPDEKKDIIFERFTQADEGLSRKHEGTGLGLAVVKQILSILGGKIWFRSTTGKGTTFYFTVPYEKKEEIIYPVPLTRDIHNDHSGKTILVVEDDIASYELYSRILKRNNFTVLHAEDGLKAVEICESGRDIDLVLMDIHLPGLNGCDATKQIINKRNNLPIIAQTAYALDENKNKCLLAGCVDYITKPVEETEMISLINKYLYEASRKNIRM